MKFESHLSKVTGPERSWLDQTAAAAICVALGLRLSLTGFLNTAVVVPALFLPVWLATVITIRAKWVALLGAAAVVSGVWLSSLAASSHVVIASVSLQRSALIVEIILGAGALIWSRTTIGSAPTAFLYGVGLLGHQMLTGFATDNPWKFELFTPVVICLLAGAWWAQRPSVELLVLIGLAILSALSDSRSAASILAMSAILLLWQRWRAALRLRSTVVRMFFALALVGTFSYFAMQTFILDGLLGGASQARSEAQIAASGSLLLGGRPELGATVALLSNQPGGYGVGTVLSQAEMNVAKEGMAAIHYDPNNRYVEVYMFGNGIEVHSVLGDLWLRHGLLGLAFALSMIGTILVGAVRQLAYNRGRALTTFLAVQVLWDAMFSPFYYPAIQILTIGLALCVRLGVEDRPPDSGSA